MGYKKCSLILEERSSVGKVIWTDRFGKPKRYGSKNPDIALRKLDEAIAKSQRILEYINAFTVDRNEVLRLMDVLRTRNDVHTLVDAIIDADQIYWRSNSAYYLAVIKLLEEKISPDDSSA